MSMYVFHESLVGVSSEACYIQQDPPEDSSCVELDPNAFSTQKRTQSFAHSFFNFFSSIWNALKSISFKSIFQSRVQETLTDQSVANVAANLDRVSRQSFEENEDRVSRQNLEVDPNDHLSESDSCYDPEEFQSAVSNLEDRNADLEASGNEEPAERQLPDGTIQWVKGTAAEWINYVWDTVFQFLGNPRSPQQEELSNTSLGEQAEEADASLAAEDRFMQLQPADGLKLKREEQDEPCTQPPLKPPSPRSQNLDANPVGQDKKVQNPPNLENEWDVVEREMVEVEEVPPKPVHADYLLLDEVSQWEDKDKRKEVNYEKGVTCYYFATDVVEMIVRSAKQMDFGLSPEVKVIGEDFMELAKAGLFEKVEITGGKYAFYLKRPDKPIEGLGIKEQDGIVILSYKEKEYFVHDSKITFNMGMEDPSIEYTYTDPTLGMKHLKEFAQECKFELFEDLTSFILPEQIGKVKRVLRDGLVKFELDLITPLKGKVKATNTRDLSMRSLDYYQLSGISGCDLMLKSKIVFSFDPAADYGNGARMAVEDGGLKAKANLVYFTRKLLKPIANQFLGSTLDISKPYPLVAIRERTKKSKSKEKGTRRQIGLTTRFEVKRGGVLEQEEQTLWFTKDTLPKAFSQIDYTPLDE